MLGKLWGRGAAVVDVDKAVVVDEERWCVVVGVDVVEVDVGRFL